MTSKEKEVLELIKTNPLIEQSEIAKILKIKRSTVAVHICSLQRKGYLLGKGYLLNNESYVLGIGACNVDVYGKSKIKIRTHYDHPADISTSVGGVMHNIITNCAKLGYKIKLITAYSDDAYGNSIKEDCITNNIDISDSLFVKDKSSGVFMQIQDDNNDMYLAICDMSIIDEITPEYIRKKKQTILNSKLVVIDPSLKDETIMEIINICKDRIPIYLDPISDNYAIKMKPYLKDIYCVKPNQSELENFTGLKIKNEDDVIKACQKLIRIGVKKVFASRGKDGLVYVDETQVIKAKLKSEKKMVNASGAGDALFAGIIYGDAKGITIKETINYGLAAGIAAIRSMKTINDDMSIELLDKILKENLK